MGLERGMEGSTAGLRKIAYRMSISCTSIVQNLGAFVKEWKCNHQCFSCLLAKQNALFKTLRPSISFRFTAWCLHKLYCRRYIVALRLWSGCCNKILYAALSVLEAVGILFPSSLNVLLCCVFGNKSDSWNFLVHWFAKTMLRTLQHPETCPDYWFPSPLLSRSWQACGAQQQEVGATYSSLGHSQLVSCKSICNSVARIDMCRTYVIFQSSFIFNHREDRGILYHPDSDIQVSCRNVDFSHLQEDDIGFTDSLIYSISDPYSVCLCVCVCVLYSILTWDSHATSNSLSQLQPQPSWFV